MGKVGGRIKSWEKVYLDTSVYIFLFKNHQVYGEKVEKLFFDLADNSVQVMASYLLLTELLVLPLKEGLRDLASVYTQLELKIPNFEWVKFDKSVAIESARLRAQYNVATPDAIHLATAILVGADVLITNDKRLIKLEEEVGVKWVGDL